LYSVYFVNNEIGYIAGEGIGSGTILKTTNGGLNWIIQNSGTANALYTLYFCNENTGYVVGGAGTILKTIDGGTNWTSQYSGTSNLLFTVYFSDPNIGYVAGDNGTILMTTNGGITVGVSDNNIPSSRSLKIYPNPSLDEVTIESSLVLTKSQLSIMNMNGQQVISRQITEPKIQLDISNLPSGIYVVRLINGKSVEVGKFVKQ